MNNVTEIRHIGTIKEYHKTSIDVKLIQISSGEYRYDIRKYHDGEHGFRGISLEEEAAKSLFVLLGKEFGYLTPDATVETQENEKKAKKLPFLLEAEDMEKIEVSPQSISLKKCLDNINAVVDKEHMKSLSITSLKKWLVKEGYLSEEKREATIKRTYQVLNDKSQEIGITERKTYDTETKALIGTEVVFTEKAQRFLISNLTEIASV